MVTRDFGGVGFDFFVVHIVGGFFFCPLELLNIIFSSIIQISVATVICKRVRGYIFQAWLYI